MSESNIQQSILKAIDTIAQRRIEQLELDKTIIGIIDSDGYVTANGKKVYRIKYEGGFFYASANDAYLINTAVYIQVPKGDFSRDKFILGKVNNAASNAQKSVVSAIANNYGIIGKNIVDNLDANNFGVHSYHSINKEEIEDGNIESVYHRYNLLYQYDKEDNPISILDGDLKKYKENATAIMIRANFMTKLSSEQKRQASGEYGLIFSLAFKNLAAETDKDTYREIFDSFSEDIKAEVLSPDSEEEQYYEVSLKSEDVKIYNLLHNNDEESLYQIDYILNEILELQRVFVNNNFDKYTTLMETYTNAYINMLKDIVRVNNLIDGLEIYEDWMNTEPEIPREKIVSYYISSNNMIGNPFILTSWTTQYEVFSIDLENLLRIDSIYLYQTGFIQNYEKEKNYLNGEPDILVKDLQFYAMKPLTDYNGTYQLKVETPETGMIFTAASDDKSSLRIEATLVREYFENLTKSSNTSFYWFKQDKNVVSPQQEDYNVYAGPGWKEATGNRYDILTTLKEDNPARENYYKCVAVYSGEETPIVLKYDFIIYNESGQKFVLTSDQLNDFSFDSGTPILTVYKEEDGELIELNSDSDYQQYQMVWTLIDGNGQATVLQLPQELTDEYTVTMPVNRVLKNIKFFKQDIELNTKTDDLGEATRIKYPMSNVASSASVTFEVRIGYKANRDSDTFYSIGMATITLNNHKITNLSSYRLVIENGSQVFQYDEYGNAPNSNKVKDPQEILPLKARIFAPNNLEVAEQNFRTKWFFPTRESMISQGNSTWKYNPTTGDINMYEGQMVDFAISNLFNYNAFDNQIICQVTFTDLSNGEDKIFTQSTTFNFVKVGDNGTNGTDMVAKIEPKVNNSLYIEQPPTIITYIENNIKKAFINSSEYGFNSFYDLTDKDNGLLTVKLYQKTEEVNLENAQIRWNIAGNTSTASNRKGKYFEIEDYDLVWNAEQEGYRQQIIKAEVNYEHKSYYAFYSMPIIEYVNKPSVLTKNRIGIDVKTYLKDVLYNADGRNPLYSHNQGLRLINLPDNYYIEWEACGGYNEQENTPCIHLLLEKDAKQHQNNYCTMNSSSAAAIVSKLNSNREEDEEEVLLDSWLEENNINSFSDMIYILPDDEFAGNITNNYIKASVYSCDVDFNKELIAIVYAPINMTLNTFGLASVNAWDGNSITLDDERGAILAPQIAAGEKDNTTNKFTGVVAGKAEDYSDTKGENLLGLFGYSNGLRSFILDATDGSATFGVPNVKIVDEGGRIVESETVQKWNGTEYETIDNYGEGQIKLVPNGMSTIGGWRFGRQSLYYTMRKSIETGEENYRYSGEIGPKFTDDYARLHKKDIGIDDQGILLSANPPYISIKGKEIPEIPPSQQDQNSQITSGDSVEIQLDPENIASLAIFRHWVEEKENGERVDRREQISGLNTRGQLVANQMIQIPVDQEEDEQTASTSLGVEQISAFNDTAYEFNYIGLNLGLKAIEGNNSAFDQTTTPFFRVFLDKSAMGTDKEVYITGGKGSSKEYERPLSLYGKTLSLYAGQENFAIEDNETNYRKTKSFIQISKEKAIVQAYPNTHLDLNTETGNDDNYSSLSTENPFKMIIGKSTKRKFTLNTGEQDITSNSDIKITTTTGGTYSVASNGAIDIKTTNNNANISLMRNNGSNIGINSDNITMKIDDNNLFELNSSDNTQLITNNNISIEGTNNNVNNSNGITLKTTNKATVQQIQNGDFREEGLTVDNIIASLKLHSWGVFTGIQYPLDINLGTKVGSLRVSRANNDQNAKWEVGMDQWMSGGLQIDGQYQGGNGLSVTNKAHFSSDVSIGGNIPTVGKITSTGAISTISTIHANGQISTSTGFSGDGTNVKNTVNNRDSTTGSSGSVSGLGSSDTGSFAAVTIDNDGRPTFSTRTMYVSIPSASTIYDAIKSSISSQISDALADYVKKTTLDNYAKKGTYYIDNDHELLDGYADYHITYVTSVTGGKDSISTSTDSTTLSHVNSSINANRLKITI